MRTRSRLLLATILGTAVATASGPSIAQDDNGVIETVVVTTKKRAENVQDVSISMEAFKGETLEKFNITTLRSLTAMVPNFYFSPNPGNDALYIRGFGSSPTNGGFEQSVSMYQDGIYAGRARQFMAPFFDVDHVEVLRGPQGALLGKNTAAGAVSITTANPTDAFEGRVTAGYNFDRQGFDTYGYVSGPITDDFGARLAIKITDYDGYITDTALNQKVPQSDSQMGRLTLQYKPEEGLDITAKVEYGNFNMFGDNAVGVPAFLSTNAVGPVSTTKTDTNIFGIPVRDSQQSWNGSLTVNYGIGDHTLTSITGVSTYHSYRSTNPAHETNARFTAEYFERFSQISQEVRLLSPTGQTFEYIIGGYYDRSDYNVGVPTYFNVPAFFSAGRIDIDFKQNSSTWSVFAAGTWHILPSLRLLGSARYTYGAKDATFVETLAPGTVAAAAVGGPRNFAKALSEDNFDPSVTVEWDALDDVMLYATYGRGSKGGGFVSVNRVIAPNTFSYLEERSTNYEVGVKSTWLDGRLIANLTAFHTAFTDLQVSAYSPALAVTLTTNAAEAYSQGLEGSFTWLPIDALQLSTSFAYTEGGYDDYPGAACLAPQLQPAPPCTTATNNLKGYRLMFLPKWSGTTSATYTHPIGDDLKLVTTLMARFKSSYIISQDYSPIYGVQEGWAKLDARFELGAADDKWSLALVTTNLTDEVVVPYSYLFPFPFAASGNRNVFYVEEPRTVSIEGTLRF